jgi:hypothetical protein
MRKEKVENLQRGDIIAVFQYNGFSFAVFWGWDSNGYTTKEGVDRKAWYHTIPDWSMPESDIRKHLDKIKSGKYKYFPGGISWTVNYAERKVLPVPETYLTMYQQEYVKLLNNKLR